MSTAPNRVLGLSVDCTDAVTLANFWSAVLARPVSPGASEQNATLEATDPAQGPRLSFHQVPEAKSVKNRLHLDLINPDYAEELERLRGLGATVVNTVDLGTVRWTTLADIEGNEFDLVAG